MPPQGKADTPAPLKDIGTTDLYWGTWGQGLLTDWWETTADLIWPQSVITYGRMRHDPQLKAVVSAYVLPIIRATWLIDPEGCRDEVVKRTADDLGVGILGTDLKPGPARRKGVIWNRHLKQALMSQLVYGHMPFERRYRVEGSALRLDNLGPRMPWTIARIMLDKGGLIDHIVQTTQPEPIPQDRLVWYVNDLEGANWAGISMLRAAFGAWLLKHEAWRVHATSIRRFGMGVPTVTAPAGGTQTMVQQAQMLASAMRAGDQAGVGLPAGFTAGLAGLTGSVPDAIAFIKYLDEAMAKMVLAGLIELGTSSHGSRALGETFMDLFLLSLQGVADELATNATSGQQGCCPGIITDLVTQNWGEDEPAPRIVCTDVGQNYVATAQALQLLVSSGALSPDASLDTWVRERWHLPEREGAWAPGLPPKTTVRENVQPTGGEQQTALGDVGAVPPKGGGTLSGGGGPANPQTPAGPTQAPQAKYDPLEKRDRHGRWTGGGHEMQSLHYNDVPETRGPGRSKGQFNGPTGRDLADQSKQGTQQNRVVEDPITEKEKRDDARAVSDAEYQELARKGVNQLARLRAMRSDPQGLRNALPQLKRDAYAEVQKSWGGMTVDAHTGKPLASNADKYALSVKKAGVHTVTLPENASQDQFNAAMDEAMARFGGELTASQAHLGIFHDDEEHRIDIDPVLVVNTKAEVEQIGAYTHAIGGAYHFASGNGFWPPYVKNETHAAAGEDTVHFDGPGQWRTEAEMQQPGLTPEQDAEIEALANSMRSAAFNPMQLRDYHGRWALEGDHGPLKVPGEFSLPKGHAMRAKVDKRLSEARVGKHATRPALPGYDENVSRVADHLQSLIDAHGTLGAGRAWYHDEHDRAVARAKKYGVPVEVAAAVEAATSPRCSYDKNQQATEKILELIPGKSPAEVKQIIAKQQLGGGIMRKFMNDGIQIAAGEHPDKVLGGPKRRPFYNNIMYPGATQDVTIDTWMNQSLGSLGLDKNQAAMLAQEKMAGLAAGVGQVMVADAVRQAATRYGVSPDAVQAAYWIAAQKQAGNMAEGGRSKGGYGAGQKLNRGGKFTPAASALSFDPWTATDDEYDAELLLEYLAWRKRNVPGRVDLGVPSSAKEDGSLASDNPEAWKLAMADPRWNRLSLTAEQARGIIKAAWDSSLHPRDKNGRFRSGLNPALRDALKKLHQDRASEEKKTGPAGVPLPPPEGEELAFRNLWQSSEGATVPTPAESAAASDIWYGHRYVSTNATLRFGDPASADPSFQHDVQTFTDLINRSPAFDKWGYTFHGMSGAEQVFGPPGTAEGKTVIDRGFTSLTADYSMASTYAGDTVVRVHIPPGGHAYKADEATWKEAGNGSNYPLSSVQEYTTAPGSRFAVIKDTPSTLQDPAHGVGTYRNIDVVLLPPEKVAASEWVSAAARGSMSGLPGGQRFGWLPGELEVL